MEESARDEAAKYYNVPLYDKVPKYYFDALIADIMWHKSLGNLLDDCTVARCKNTARL